MPNKEVTTLLTEGARVKRERTFRTLVKRTPNNGTVIAVWVQGDVESDPPVCPLYVRWDNGRKSWTSPERIEVLSRH